MKLSILVSKMHLKPEIMSNLKSVTISVPLITTNFEWDVWVPFSLSVVLVLRVASMSLTYYITKWRIIDRNIQLTTMYLLNVLWNQKGTDEIVSGIPATAGEFPYTFLIQRFAILKKTLSFFMRIIFKRFLRYNGNFFCGEN